jgi:hypothetical protein
VNFFQIIGKRGHSKASERYVDVIFHYNAFKWELAIPIEYRRTGLHIEDDDEKEIKKYVESVYEEIHPSKWEKWKQHQKEFWKDRNADVTKPFFDCLARDFKWKSNQKDLPENTNKQRRIQDIKEMGYTLATKNIGREYFTMLLPLKRGGITGYEVWSDQLRDSIISILKGYDAYEGKNVPTHGLLPDHKFPEIRWDEKTKRTASEISKLSATEIQKDFQLINNQRNQQKREACRTCFQTGLRGYPFGIQFYYKGVAQWPKNIPVRGKEAEKGCIGCGWYDLEKWRKELIRKLT